MMTRPHGGCHQLLRGTRRGGQFRAGRQDLTRHLAEAEPSLIILDLRLGREDGLDLLREIRSNSDVPVIITTGTGWKRSTAWSASNSVRTTT